MIFLLILLFILGSAVGSFLNVVIDRSIKRESLMGRSYCDHCRATLSSIDLVPIISFVTLGRKCRYCKKPLSWQYPAVELATGLLFVFVFLFLSQSSILTIPSILYFFTIISIFIVVFVIDFKFSLIPTSFVFAGSLLSLIYNYFFLNSSVFVDHVIGAFLCAIFFLTIVFLTRGRGMGEGDIFLGFFIGMILGIKAGILAIFLAFVIGAIVSVFLILFGKKHFGQTVPFAPFLVFGFLISLFFSSPILSWYLMIY